MRFIELLSPAKNLACGIEAVRHGADAVYIGAPRFGARAAAGNSVEDIAELVRFAHPYGVKIYVTLNTLLHDDELPEAQTLIHDLAAVGVDALITQDPRITPASSAVAGDTVAVVSPIPLHSSTQMDNRTIDDIRARLAAGYEQTVLARELSLDDIRAIHAAVPAMPLEVFVHGALCVSYSGRCYASEYCFGRSANRGECAQFCRLPFDLVDADGRLVTDADGRPLRQRHLLSLKDMNRSADLEALMDAGVSSFKIEGRLKDVSYVKNITAYYRQRIDAILQRRAADYRRASFGTTTCTFTPDPYKSFNRGFTDYFLHGRTAAPIHQPLTPKSLGEPVGAVKDVRAYITVAGTASFANGDGLCFFAPDGQLHGFRVNRIDQQGRLYPADPSVCSLLRKGTPLYRNYDAAFERQLKGPTADRRIPVRWLLEDTAEGFRLTLLAASGGESSLLFPYPHELARSPQADNLRRQLLRLGDTPYACTEADITIRFTSNWFIPASVLGEWRRQLVEKSLANASEPRATPEPRASQLPSLTGGVGGGSSEGGSFGGGSSLMTCRHCLRHAIGRCTRDAHASPPRGETDKGSLSLRLADGRTFPLRFDCKRCQMQVLKMLVCILACILTSCYNPPHHVILDPPDADTTTVQLNRPYGVGYNMVVHADSLPLVEARPMHWSEGADDSSDTLFLRRHDALVLAAFLVIPEDTVDSVWVKVARDQLTMGWLHESDLLRAATPDDPISRFIHFFSDSHVLWFLVVMAVACAIVLVHLLRRQRFRMILLDDIPSPYPTLLTTTLALSAWLYALIQHAQPQMWVQFYFHPTLNPFSQPTLLCLFLCTVWAQFFLLLTVLDDVVKMLPASAAVLYLLALAGVSMVIYLVVSLTPITLAAVLVVLYTAVAFWRYWTSARPRYLCGRCHQRLQHKGRCPYCGTIND